MNHPTTPTRRDLLALLLEGLSVAPDISTVEARKNIQKAAYLGQRIGLDLGYRYNWYLMGPYCSPLAHDYYSLEPSDGNGWALEPDLSKRLLEAQTQLLQPPEELSLGVSEWLEVVASYDFLRQVKGRTHEEAVETFKADKPQLTKFIPAARKALLASNLLDA